MPAPDSITSNDTSSDQEACMISLSSDDHPTQGRTVSTSGHCQLQQHDDDHIPDVTADHILAHSSADAVIVTDDNKNIIDDTATIVAEWIDVSDGAASLSVENMIVQEQLARRALPDQHWINDKQHEEAFAEQVKLANGQQHPWNGVIFDVGFTERVAINSFSVSKEINRFAASSYSPNTEIKVFDMSGGEFLCGLEAHNDPVLSVALSPDGQYLVSGSASSVALIWDIAKEEVISTLEGHSDSIVAVKYSPDGRTIATGSNDQVVHLWTNDGERLFRLDHDGPVVRLQFSSDSKHLLAFSHEIGYIWDCVSGSQLVTLDDHTGATICSVKFSNQGDRIVTGSDDGTVRIWDSRTAEQLVTYKHKSAVWTVDFSPDGSKIASGSYDQTIAVIDSSSGHCLYTIDRSAPVVALAYSYDGKYIACGDIAGFVKIWEARDGAFVAEVKGHINAVMALAWSGDDIFVVSAGEDGTLRPRSVRDILRLID